MEQTLDNDLLQLNKLKTGSSSSNPVADLQSFLLSDEQTYFKSPYVADTYKTPYNPDDLYQKNFNYSIYEKMINDDQVSVCMRLKKDLVLGDGFHFVSQSDDQHELCEFLQDCLENQYEGDFVEDIEEILTAYDFGFSLTEKTFKIVEDNGFLSIKKLKTRHPNSWLIYQDDKGNITKFEQKTVAGDIDVSQKSLIHNINNKQFGNPYGVSDLRAAYNAWVAKVHIVKFFSIFLEKSASPIPVGRYDKNAPQTAVDKLFEVLKKFQTKTAITIPKDIEVQFLEAQNKGEVYRLAIHLFNMFIGRALFVPDLLGFTGSETSGGSLALGKEQMGLFFLHIIRRRNSLQNIINKEIVSPIIKYNFGIIKNPPKFCFKPIDDLKSLEFAKVWLEAVKGNAYKANDEEINHFRKLVKFPVGEVFRQAYPSGQDQQGGMIEDIESENEDGNLDEMIDMSKDKSVDPPYQKKNEDEPKKFISKYDQTSGDYHKKVNFKAIKTKFDDYDNSVKNETQVVVKKSILDLLDQIEKKKIIQNQNLDRIDSISLKYKKELKQILKNSFMQLYKDSQTVAASEIEKSNFATKPIVQDKFLEVIDQETFRFIGDWEYNILKKTRTELIAAIKDGIPLSSVLSQIEDSATKMSDIQIERFSRTKHTEVFNNGRVEYFDSTGVVSGYQYSAILDDRTSEICSGLHGKFFKSGDQPIPPMHFNCRSTLIPITKYEKFTPTESIRGMSPNEFIDENKGEGFSKYSIKNEHGD